MIIIILSVFLGILITNWIVPPNRLWQTVISQTSLLFLYNILLLNSNSSWFWTNLSFLLSPDQIGIPLIILSCWLLPISLLASINSLSNNTINEIRTFNTIIILIFFFLILSFSITDLLLFFLCFEATLTPTLFLITRWGMQKERTEAGYYFVFYTLISSLPLLLSLLLIYSNINHLNFIINSWNFNQPNSTILIIFCIVAFLVKVPIFSFHLWLPKAHVEAPVAGSMILAAILLKLGGYGFIRLYFFLLSNSLNEICSLIILFCCWGGLLTSLICITQTDLKSLIAYSSVSHMSFMIASLATGTNWAITASIITMIAHGIVSSALFSLANLFYERSGTRTLIISRNLKSIYSILSIFWLFFALGNLGFPPLPNAVGEVLTFITILNWNLISFLPIIGTILLTSIFSLSFYQILCSGWSLKSNNINTPLNERELLTITLHIIPLILLILIPQILQI